MHFFVLLLFLVCCFAQGQLQTQTQIPTVTLEGIAKCFIHAIAKGGTLIKPYSHVFRTNGPFFVPLWKMGGSYKLFSAIGLPSAKQNLTDAINPKFSANHIIMALVSYENRDDHGLNNNKK